MRVFDSISGRGRPTGWGMVENGERTGIITCITRVYYTVLLYNT